jgi:hypothetical protein
VTDAGRHRLLLLLLALPLLPAAADPTDDASPCRGSTPVRTTLDLAGADGFMIEDGTAVEFRVRFHGAPAAPDPEEPAFRVDIVLRDPRLQTFSVGPYREINRIIRFEATDPPEVGVLLLPERGFSAPSTFVFEDGQLRVTLAARQFGIESENLEGIDLRPIRWNVVARDGNACDALTEGRPVLRLLEATPPPTSSQPATPSPTSAAEGRGGGSLGARVGIAFVVLLGAGVIAVAVVVVGRRRGAENEPGPGQSSGL